MLCDLPAPSAEQHAARWRMHTCKTPCGCSSAAGHARSTPLVRALGKTLLPWCCVARPAASERFADSLCAACALYGCHVGLLRAMQRATGDSGNQAGRFTMRTASRGGRDVIAAITLVAATLGKLERVPSYSQARRRYACPAASGGKMIG